MDFDAKIAFGFVNGLGLMALIAVLYGTVLRIDPPAGRRSALFGMIFGLGAIAAMTTPFAAASAPIMDAGKIIVGLCGAFGGIPALVATTLMAAAYRIWLGGNSVPLGVVTIMIAACAGAMWRHHWPAGQKVGVGGLCILGAAIAFSAITVPFMPLDVPQLNLLLFAGMMFVIGFAATLTLGTMMQREATQIERERSLSDYAYGDPLTSLPNRRAFSERLASAEFSDNGKTFSLLVIDVDRFKSVNDTYGHGAGDMVLRRIADVLKSCARDRDLCARFGGEEFVMLMPQTRLEEAFALAETLRLRIAAQRIDLLGEIVPVTVSIGAASASGNAGRRDIVAIADEALYKAKELGRNQTVVSERDNVVNFNGGRRAAANA